MRPLASATSSFRTTSTASTLPSPRIATGETRTGARPSSASRRAASPATSRITSTLRRAIAVSSSSAAGSPGRAPGRPDRPRGRRPRARSARCSSGVVNAAWAGPRRPSTRISRIPEPRIAAIASSVVSVGSISSRGEREHPGHVDRDVPVADDDRALGGEVERDDPGSRGGRCTRRRTRSPAMSRAGPRRGCPSAGRPAPRRRRRRRRRASSARRARRHGRPRRCRRSGSPGRCAIRSKARETDLILGWSGATPSRTRPHGVGSRSNMSTSTAGSSLASNAPAA